ncbi:MAG TPA: formimidoylglutamase [Cytophagaceae bacterium]|jgi:formiminoglutamase|nr:formimidoylglutamase [Cytophagaceae bacterium]
MNLRIFFDPISEELIKEKEDASLFGTNIRLFQTEFPDLDKISVVIIGLSEDRGSLTNKGSGKGADEIRKKLYRLKKGSVKLHTADLGNLRSGETIEDTYLRLKEVCEILMQLNILPIIIGGSHDLSYGQFLSYENTGKLINMMNVDAFIDMSGLKEDQSKHHIHRILVHQPNIIFNYSHLGYQTYLTDQEVINVLEKLHFEAYRVGRVRENMEEIEPVVRDADMISFDISAIRQTDAPGNKNSQPFGFSGEEACMLCWYAGLSTKLTSIGFYEFNPEEDVKGQTAGVVATMIWYFMEGFYMRKEDTDVSGSQYTKYLVSVDSAYDKLVFFKNNFTEKWWMEVPYPEEKSKLARNSIVPCSYSDYLIATKGEVPDRWILTHAKLI